MEPNPDVCDACGHVATFTPEDHKAHWRAHEALHADDARVNEQGRCGGIGLRGGPCRFDHPVCTHPSTTKLWDLHARYYPGHTVTEGVCDGGPSGSCRY